MLILKTEVLKLSTYLSTKTVENKIILFILGITSVISGYRMIMLRFD